MSARPGAVDWWALFRRLMHGKTRLRPWEIMRLTLAEVVLALDDNLEDPRPSGGIPLLAAADLEAFAARRRAMTPADRLTEARARWSEA